MNKNYTSLCCNSKLLEYDELSSYCDSCYSVFTNNLPTDEELRIYYNNFLKSYTGGGRSIGSSKRQQKYAKKYLKFLKRYCKGHTIMDIGSANNPFPNLANENGFNVTVVDFNKPINLDDNINYICSSVENLKAVNNIFDAVTAFAIIEHTKNPKEAISNIVNATKPNGIIIIYVPEIGRFFDNYALGTSKWYFPPQHLNLLSKKGLENIMLKLECKLVHYSRFELNLIRYLMRYGIGLIEGIVGFLVKRINKNIWIKIRKRRKSKYNGLSLFVFKKY